MTNLKRAAAIAVAVPLILLVGAYGSEMYGLVACEMCWWQRWAHFAALATGIPALLLQLRQVRDLAPHDRVDAATRFWVTTAACSILASGLIGGYHAGVEYGWWEGHTACTAAFRPTAGGDLLAEMMRQPLVRCDTAQWTLLGVSLAGYNAIISTLTALVVLTLTHRGRRS
jgi:disulfide bond formation protein DsbB